MVRRLLLKLPLKKGADGIVAEHLCCADHSIFHYLAIFLIFACVMAYIVTDVFKLIIPGIESANSYVQNLNNYCLIVMLLFK